MVDMQPNVPEPVQQTLNLPEERKYFEIYTYLFFSNSEVKVLEFSFLPDYVILYAQTAGKIKAAWDIRTRGEFTMPTGGAFRSFFPVPTVPLKIPGVSRYLTLYTTLAYELVTIIAYKGYEK